MEKDELVVQDIINGAKKLMQQYGLKKTTMEDIAKSAGKSKATLYYYFKDKEEIFDRVISLEVYEFYQTVNAAVNKQPNAVDMLKAYMVTKLKTLREKTTLYSFLIENDLQGRLNNEIAKVRHKYDDEERKLLSSILIKGVETKVFKEEIVQEMDVISSLLVSCVRGVEIDIVEHKINKDLDKKADFFIELILRGIAL